MAPALAATALWPFLSGFVLLRNQPATLPVTTADPVLTFYWDGSAPVIEDKEKFADEAWTDLSDADYMAQLLGAAVGIWNDVPGAFVVLEVQEDGEAAVLDDTDDKFSLVVAHESNLSTAAFARPTFDEEDPTRIRDCDISISNRKVAAKELAYIIAHELGHCLGLGHAHTNYRAMMGYSRDARDFSLGADDMAGLIYLYPEEGASEPKELVCGAVGANEASGSAAPAALLALCVPFVVALRSGRRQRAVARATRASGKRRATSARAIAIAIGLGASTSLMGLIGATPAEARWEGIEEANAVNVEQSIHFDVRADGSYDTTFSRTIEIRRDAARTSMGTVSFTYNAAAAKVLSVSAQTLTPAGKVLKVGKEHIEDRPETGEDLGFDKNNRVTIAFPKVEVGSRLTYSFKMRTHTVPVPGVYAEAVSFGGGTPDLPPVNVKWTSRLPLIVKATDSEGYLDVSDTSKGGVQTVVVTLKRPAYFSVVNETGRWFPGVVTPMVEVGSTKDWGLLAKTLSPQYEHELTQPLPDVFKHLADEAKAKNTGFIDRTNAFTAALADTVRYMGDWRTVKGGHVPRPLATIAKTAFGDCKDLSAVTTAALRRMGYKANQAWIYRSDAPPSDRGLPASEAFNHAIVRAEDEDGQVHWIDPTNNASRAHGMRRDLVDRAVLVVDGAKSRLERTPKAVPSDNKTVRRSVFDFDPVGETALARHEVTFFGSSAELLTGAELAMPRGQIDEALARSTAEENEVLWKEIMPYTLTSRIVRDLSFVVSVKSRWTVDETTAGYSYAVKPFLTSLRKLDLTGRVSGYWIDLPGEIEAEYTLRKAAMVGDAPPPCEVKSPWVDGTQKIRSEGDDIVIARTAAIKAYGIPVEDLKSEAFGKLQRDLKKCLGNYAVVFRKAERTAAVTPEETERAEAWVREPLAH